MEMCSLTDKTRTKCNSQLLGSIFHDITGHDANLPGDLAFKEILHAIDVDVEKPESLWRSFDEDTASLDEDSNLCNILRSEISWRIQPKKVQFCDLDRTEDSSFSEFIGAWKGDQWNTNARKKKNKSISRGMELWKKARARIMANVKLLPGRVRSYPVVTRCPVLPSPFEREIEKAEFKSAQRRDAHLKSCLSDWTKECEAYDKLVEVIKKFRLSQFIKKRRKSKTNRNTADQEVPNEEITVTEILTYFRYSCSSHFGSSLGVHRFVHTSDVFRHWWVKASLLLQQKTSLDEIPSITSGGHATQREETFWIFSPRYFDTKHTSALAGYEKIDDYVVVERVDPVKHPRQCSSLCKETVNTATEKTLSADIETPSFSREDSLPTEELFRHPSDLFYLETIKSVHNSTASKNGPLWKQVKDVLAEKANEDGSQVKQKVTLAETAPPASPFGKVTRGQRPTHSGGHRSTVIRHSIRHAPLISGKSSVYDDAGLSLQRLSSIIQEPSIDIFRQRMEALRNFYFLPASVVKSRCLMNPKDLEDLLPTEDLLKAIILQLPHEEDPEEELQEMLAVSADEQAHLKRHESVKHVLQMTLKEFPALVRLILGGNDVAVERRREIISRRVITTDNPHHTFGVREIDEVLLHAIMPPIGLRSGGERHLITCLLPELVPRGIKHKAFPTQFILGNYLVFDQEDNCLPKRPLVLMLPAEIDEAINILDLASRSMQRYEPHVTELFNKVLRSIRPSAVWLNEKNNEVIGIALAHLGHDLLHFRNTPGHCVRFKLLSVIKCSQTNSPLMNQLALTAKLPNGWLDQVLRSLGGSSYLSVRKEVALVIAGMATHRKLMRRLTRVPGLLYGIAVALIRSADLFVESFCDFFLALAYIFHYNPHRVLVEAALDRWPTLQSVRMISAWPLLLVYAFKYWQPSVVSEVAVGSRRMAALLNESLHNPLSRHNARIAVDVVEGIIHLRNTMVTRWPEVRKQQRGQTASMMQRIENLGPPSMDDEFFNDDNQDEDSDDGYELYDGVLGDRLQGQ